MKTKGLKRNLVAVCAGLCLALCVVTPTSATRICGTYYGTPSCIIINRGMPAKATTSKDMRITASTSQAKVGDIVTLTASGKAGHNGFSAGEFIRFFDLHNGHVSELTGGKFANRKGAITWSREFMKIIGIDETGVHDLCALGEGSGKVACARVTVSW